MIRQAFTEENFRKIFDYENRKGKFLEGRFFPQLQIDTAILKEVAAEFRKLKNQKNSIPQLEYEHKKEDLNKRKSEAKKLKDEKLTNELKRISEAILNGDFKLELKKLPLPTGKIAYGPDKNCPISYFAIKQVQYNIKSVYKVKQNNRNYIISQLVALLGDSLPKWVVRLDVKNFYESIPHKLLIEKINKDSVLSYTSIKIIQKILNEYSRISASSVGIPRGIGISAYLSELYMRKFDEKIVNFDETVYYARYVDDIIIIASPANKISLQNFVDKISAELSNSKLEINRSKLQMCDLSSPRQAKIEYLGYEIIFGNGHINLKISNKKINKYKKRIDISIAQYEKSCSCDYKDAASLLYKRIKFLTGNTRLWNNKRFILTGVFFSNYGLTDTSCLIGLDRYLKYKISSNSKIKNQLKKKLSTLSFEKGFSDVVFSVFSVKEMGKITRVWKSVAY